MKRVPRESKKDLDPRRHSCFAPCSTNRRTGRREKFATQNTRTYGEAFREGGMGESGFGWATFIPGNHGGMEECESLSGVLQYYRAYVPRPSSSRLFIFFYSSFYSSSASSFPFFLFLFLFLPHLHLHLHLHCQGPRQVSRPDSQFW